MTRTLQTITSVAPYTFMGDRCEPILRLVLSFYAEPLTEEIKQDVERMLRHFTHEVVKVTGAFSSLNIDYTK